MVGGELVEDGITDNAWLIVPGAYPAFGLGFPVRAFTALRPGGRCGLSSAVARARTRERHRGERAPTDGPGPPRIATSATGRIRMTGTSPGSHHEPRARERTSPRSRPHGRPGTRGSTAPPDQPCGEPSPLAPPSRHRRRHPPRSRMPHSGWSPYVALSAMASPRRTLSGGCPPSAQRRARRPFVRRHRRPLVRSTSYVVIELKTGKLTPADVGQLR